MEKQTETTVESSKRFISKQFDALINLYGKPTKRQVEEAKKTYPVRSGKKIQRNEPCPCGKEMEIIATGKVHLPIIVRTKYKNCCLKH